MFATTTFRIVTFMKKSAQIIRIGKCAALLMVFNLAFRPMAFAAEVIGPTHQITEPDMLKAIEAHLREKEKNGEIEKMQKEVVTRAKRRLENPPGVQGLTKAERNNVFYYDPSFTVKEDVRDHTGQIIVTAGTRVNPLDYVSMSKHMLFFDGADPSQVIKAEQLIKHYNGMVKPILTNGPIGEITRKWQQQVYFDQGGSLVRKLGIKRVPSLVTQEGKKLRIDELAVEQR